MSRRKILTNRKDEGSADEAIYLGEMEGGPVCCKYLSRILI